MTTVPFQPQRFLHAAIGDVHGDLPALVAAVDAVRAKAAESGRGAFLFVLGDAIDRGPDSAGCAAFLMRLARGEDPARADARLVFVRGDHDVALSRDPATRTFSSLVEPGDWADDLNALPEDHPDRAVARAWIDFVREAPAAVLLRGEGEGVLLAHGAVPHADLLPRLQTPADVGSPDCDRDFAWCRLSSAPRKIPNRASLFCDVGLDDLADFLDRLAELAWGEATGEGSALPEPLPPLLPEAPQGPLGAAAPAEPCTCFQLHRATGEGSALPEPLPPLLPEAPQGALGAAAPAEPCTCLQPHCGEGFGEGRSPSPVRLFVHGHEHAEEGCVATPVRGGRTAWTVTSFRGEGFFRPIRPAALLLDSDAGSAPAQTRGAPILATPLFPEVPA